MTTTTPTTPRPTTTTPTTTRSGPRSTEPAPTTKADVVIVGGGIGGTALACGLAGSGLEVVLLEKVAQYHDIVRGEWLSPWGMQEARRLGVEDALAAGGAWEIREWVQWDETTDPDEAGSVDLTGLLPEIGGPQTFPHHQVCEQMALQAADAGIEVILGASRVEIGRGDRRQVHYTGADGARHTIDAGFVVGATGRSNIVGRQLGLKMDLTVHHRGAGLLVDGLDEWPSDTQAMGTEGDVMFMVFPQGYGTARLYLNYDPAHTRRYCGPDAVTEFLESFRLRCLADRGDYIADHASPVGELTVWPSMSGVPLGDFVWDGVALIGDEAGSCDTVLGTGLSSALRDARHVRDVLLGPDWSVDAFSEYVRERGARMDRLHHGAHIYHELFVEFGEYAVARRRRARRLMSENDAYQVTGLLNMIAPELVPDFGFSEFFTERLLLETR